MSDLNVAEIIKSLSEEELCRYCRCSVYCDCDNGVRSNGTCTPIYPPCADGLTENDFDLDSYLEDMGITEQKPE